MHACGFLIGEIYGFFVETLGETAEKSKAAAAAVAVPVPVPGRTKKRSAKSIPKDAWGKLLSQFSQVCLFYS